MNKYTEEQKLYLKSILEDYSSKDVIKLFYDKYNILLNENTIKCLRYRMGIKRKENSGRFIKNCIPHNKRSVEEEVVWKVNGEYRPYVKIKDRKGKKGLYISKERYIYQKHYGKLKKGYVVIFLDGNINNFDINNLVAVKKNIYRTLLMQKLNYKDKDLTETGILIASLMSKKQAIIKR